MCETTVGRELTRISIVNDKLMVVYDKLVKPLNKITDYITEFSGITKELLEDVDLTLNDVHDELFEFIDENTIYYKCTFSVCISCHTLWYLNSKTSISVLLPF